MSAIADTYCFLTFPVILQDYVYDVTEYMNLHPVSKYVSTSIVAVFPEMFADTPLIRTCRAVTRFCLTKLAEMPLRTSRRLMVPTTNESNL